MPKLIFGQDAVTIGTRLMNDRKPPKRKSPRRAVGEARPPRLGRDIQQRIGEKLRAMYGDIVDQGVPERFSTVLRQFDDPTNDKDE
jgi:hypothetical protein